jgi:L-2,4-diaminobutyrate decarboxylase
MLKDINNAENFRTLGHELIDLLADYLKGLKDEEQVYPHLEPEKAIDFWRQDFENDDLDVMAFFKKTIGMSNKLHHPKYLGHQVSAPAPITALASMVTSLMNNGGAVYEMGMVNNPIEEVINEYLAQKIGFKKNGGGFLTSGGTLANLTALLAARAKKTEVWENGTEKKLGIMVSEEAHYCVDRAARIMGLGSEGIIKIPVDSNFKIKNELLEEYFKNAENAGIEIFAIVGSSCATSTGNYDDLVPLGEFAQKHKLWFHVDGAHGGAVVFSKKHRHLINGIEKADSVIIDWHKMLLNPALITSVIFKNNDDAYNTFHQKAQYLWSNASSKDWFNLGKRTFECTKIMMGVKIYSIIKSQGKSIFAEHVDYLYGLGYAFANLISSNSVFELATQPDSNIVCFRIRNASNEQNSAIRKKILEDGKFYIVQTNLNGEVFLRISIMNPDTQLHDLELLLDEIVKVNTSLFGQKD